MAKNKRQIKKANHGKRPANAKARRMKRSKFKN
ncbi:MAG: 50S ribosomal protein bL37 [Planctomycetota bacterium]